MTLYKLQFGYLINRVSSWFLLILALVNIGGVIYATDFVNPGLQDIERMGNLLQYWNETLTMTKFLLVTAAIFLNILGFFSSFTRYHVYLVNGRGGKKRLVLAKLAALITLETLLWANACIAIHLAGFYLTPFFRYEPSFMWALFGLYGQMIILGLIGALATQIMDSIFTGIIPLSLFWSLAMKVSIEETDNLGVEVGLSTLIPNPILMNNVYVIESGMALYLLVFMVLILFNVVVFIVKDLK